MAVGNSKSVVELWDVEKQACVRKMKSHVTRIGSLCWNQHILTSGSRLGELLVKLVFNNALFTIIRLRCNTQS